MKSRNYILTRMLIPIAVLVSLFVLIKKCGEIDRDSSTQDIHLGNKNFKKGDMLIIESDSLLVLHLEINSLRDSIDRLMLASNSAPSKDTVYTILEVPSCKWGSSCEGRDVEQKVIYRDVVRTEYVGGKFKTDTVTQYVEVQPEVAAIPIDTSASEPIKREDIPTELIEEIASDILKGSHSYWLGSGVMIIDQKPEVNFSIALQGARDQVEIGYSPWAKFYHVSYRRNIFQKTKTD